MADKDTLDVNADRRYEDVDADEDVDSGEDIDVGADAFKGGVEESDEDENVVAGIDFSLDNLTRPQKIAKGRKIIEQIMELPDHPGRNSLVEELTSSIDNEQFAEYELQVTSRETREAEIAYWELSKRPAASLNVITRHGSALIASTIQPIINLYC